MNDTRVHREDYTKAKEEIFERTNIEEALWSIVEGNNTKQARLNHVTPLLQQVAYEDVPTETIPLPDRVSNPNYERKVLPDKLYVPHVYRGDASKAAALTDA